jgi:hypothetical protein
MLSRHIDEEYAVRASSLSSSSVSKDSAKQIFLDNKIPKFILERLFGTTSDTSILVSGPERRVRSLYESVAGVPEVSGPQLSWPIGDLARIEFNFKEGSDPHLVFKHVETVLRTHEDLAVRVVWNKNTKST